MRASPGQVFCVEREFDFRYGPVTGSVASAITIRSSAVAWSVICGGSHIRRWNGRDNGQDRVVKWAFRSVGPDLEGSWRYPYNPTNGTVSYGDITLFGPGNLGLGF